MTLALAQTFIDSAGRYNHALSIHYFMEWHKHGRFSTTNRAWDVGRCTRIALSTWQQQGLNDIERTQEVIKEKLDREYSSGNGSLMRIAPIGVALRADRDLARKVAKQNSQSTHPALACGEACEAFTDLVCLAMHGRSFLSITYRD